MPNRPIEAHHRKDASRIKSLHSHLNNTAQHGINNHDSCSLLRIPSESLTHITSFLDPPALFALSRANRQLYDHVKDDNTWRRAYAHQSLGISPESDFRDNNDDRALMLRREETTWRKEFVFRYNLRRRWERSRNQPVTHIPHHSAISAMHLMPSTTVLAASLKYGVVSRSYPLSGKVLRGYLDASGFANGVGIGNPNAEFSPHVTAIALASEGGTAKVLWGFRNGEVAVTTANRAMDGSRASAAKHVRCKVDDCHEGVVRDVAWGAGADGPTAFVTGAADGRVKLWDAKKVQCLWTSNKGSGLVPDPCVKVAVDVAHGVVIGAMQSGEVVVWSGLTPLLTEEQEPIEFESHEVRIPAVRIGNVPTAPVEGNAQQELFDLHMAFASPAHLSILTAYRNSCHFYRHSVNLTSGEVKCTAFGDDSTGTVHSIKPIFKLQDSESSFVIIGDQLGCIAVFSWDAPPDPGTSSVPPVWKFEAHDDGAVTALAWNAVVLVSSSARGSIKVWDSFTFVPLRSFPSPSARLAADGEWNNAKQILLERDALVVSFGTKVMAWKAGPVGTHDKGHVKGKQSRASKSSSAAKWHQQLEMYRDIMESRRDLEEEQRYTQRAYGREREQRSTLDHLGLNEVEAVEYVLMLSRDEEDDRRQRSLPPSPASAITPRDDEGVFMADFDDLQTPISAPTTAGSELASAASAYVSSFSSHSPPSSSVHYGRSLPRAVPSQSNHKVQISPRMRPEPMEAGFSTSPLGCSTSSSMSMQGAPLPSISDIEQFPVVSRTPSSAGMSPPNGTPGSSSMTRRSISGSPESYRSAWNTPLHSTRSMASVPSPRGSTASSPVVVHDLASASRVVGPSLISAGFTRENNDSATGLSSRSSSIAEDNAVVDEDLRLAIELSLAEARSRGENV
ncbi:hypothetical protein AcV5_010021 [Taiwanofungus camphoratus]|nr:hypothetical protein AcV5_010021 [Antrodia cinnamomea]